MKTNITLYLIIIALFIIYSFSIYKLGESNERIKYISQIDTLTTYQTIKDTVIVPKFRTETYRDTIILTDTTYVLETHQYIAKIDTMYEDDLARLKVEYISDIPLSKKSYFNLDLNVKKEVIFVPSYKEYEPDKWGVGFGAVGHFNDSVRVNLFGNISYKILNYKHFEFPITLEIELDNDFKMIEKTIKAEGRFKF